METYNGYLTKNFSYQEMIKSSTAQRMGVSNEATREHVINLVNLCNYILEPVRDEFGPIRINSGYRAPALNSRVGGSKTSQHCNGEAADFESSRISNPELASLASKMEIDACQESVDKADLVLMDGSLYSQFLTRQKPLANSLVNTITKKNNVIFISKTSNTKKQFENLGAIAGDIFYYNHATVSPGFSKIHEDAKFGNDMIISSVFARLAESLPLIKIELLGSGYADNDFKLILNKILNNSIGGYPYALKLAHNNCKISGKDLAKLASIHGLSNEIGSREVLG